MRKKMSKETKNEAVAMLREHIDHLKNISYFGVAVDMFLVYAAWFMASHEHMLVSVCFVVLTIRHLKMTADNIWSVHTYQKVVDRAGAEKTEMPAKA